MRFSRKVGWAFESLAPAQIIAAAALPKMAAPPPSAAVSGLMQRLAKCFVDVHHLPEVRRARSAAAPASTHRSLLGAPSQVSPGVRRGAQERREEYSAELHRYSMRVLSSATQSARVAHVDTSEAVSTDSSSLEPNIACVGSGSSKSTSLSCSTAH